MQADRLAELLDRHAAALALFAAGWTNQSDDCVQDAFIELAAQQPEPTNPAAWLFRVVRNRALNAARGERRRRDHESLAGRLRVAAHNATHTDRDFDVDQLARALDGLSDQLRQVTVLRTWSELTLAEVAAVCNCSTTTAHRRYRQALSQLREALEPSSCPNSNEASGP